MLAAIHRRINKLNAAVTTYDGYSGILEDVGQEPDKDSVVKLTKYDVFYVQMIFFAIIVPNCWRQDANKKIYRVLQNGYQ